MTIRLIAIVKNEADNLPKLPFMDGALIVDTGSTDGTPGIARDLGAEVHERPWVDFGHNRSELLHLAQGTADWLLTLDADMTVEIDPGFTPDPAVEAYMVKVSIGEFEWRMPLLIRGDLPWRSVGVVHEYLDLQGRQYIRQNTDCIRVVVQDRSSPEKSRWHAQMLEADMKAHPGNPRTIFYLAQTYRDLGDDRARLMFLRRATMGGWDQEVFYARYQAARLAKWPEQAVELMAAWESRPDRLEPLHDLVSELNRRSQHHTAFALTAIEIEPSTDALFVHANVWRWGLLFERSIAAWWVGDRVEAARLNDYLLSLPDLPAHIRTAVERNSQF